MSEIDIASIVVCAPSDHPLVDPDPTETDRRSLTISDVWDDSTIGVVGWSSGGSLALEIAAAHPELPRLVLVNVPFEVAEGLDIAVITAKTLLIFGSADPATGSKHGRLWQRSLPSARLEMVPGGGHDLLESRWPRVLSHLAPSRLR